MGIKQPTYQRRSYKGSYKTFKEDENNDPTY